MIAVIQDKIGKLNEHQLKVFRNALNFFLGKLLTPAELENLYVCVDVSNQELPENDCGHVTHDVKKFSKKRKQKAFMMVLNHNLKPIDLLKTLAHECVHIKQATRNEFFHMYSPDCRKHYPFWQNVITSLKRFNTEEPPWEKEAYQLETVLYKSFLEQLKLGK